MPGGDNGKQFSRGTQQRLRPKDDICDGGLVHPKKKENFRQRRRRRRKSQRFGNTSSQQKESVRFATAHTGCVLVVVERESRVRYRISSETNAISPLTVVCSAQFRYHYPVRALPREKFRRRRYCSLEARAAKELVASRFEKGEREKEKCREEKRRRAPSTHTRSLARFCSLIQRDHFFCSPTLSLSAVLFWNRFSPSYHPRITSYHIARYPPSPTTLTTTQSPVCGDNHQQLNHQRLEQRQKQLLQLSSAGACPVN